MENRVLRAVGYRRVSMRDQVDGYSLDAQENNIQEYVRQQGWEMVRIYTDAGISAKKDSQRPALEKMLNDARADQFDVVVVDKIDRFYRHLAGLMTALDGLNEIGVGFASVQERLDFTTHWGKLTLTVLGILAEIYIESLRLETQKGKRQRAREGLWNGKIPYGYCTGLCSSCTDPNGQGYCPEFGRQDRGNGKALIAHPVDRLGVKMAFDLYAAGGKSAATLAVELNASTVHLPDGRAVSLRHKGAPGTSLPGPFKPDAILDILANPFYTGKVPYYGLGKNGKGRKRRGNVDALYPGQHPALVDDAQFEKVQELRHLYARNPKTRASRTVRIYPLSGVILCAECGKHMRGSSGNGARRYYRDATRMDRVGVCHQPHVNAELAEEALIAGLSQTIEGAADRIRAAQEHYRQAEERYERARLLYLTGDIRRDQYNLEKERKNSIQEGLRSTIDGAILLPIDVVQDLRSAWSGMASIEQKKLLRGLIEAAFIQRDAFVAVQPTVALLPLMGKLHCNYGSDVWRALLLPGARLPPKRRAVFRLLEYGQHDHAGLQPAGRPVRAERQRCFANADQPELDRCFVR